MIKTESKQHPFLCFGNNDKIQVAKSDKYTNCLYLGILDECNESSTASKYINK